MVDHTLAEQKKLKSEDEKAEMTQQFPPGITPLHSAASTGRCMTEYKGEAGSRVRLCCGVLYYLTDLVNFWNTRSWELRSGHLAWSEQCLNLGSPSSKANAVMAELFS